MVLKPVGTRWFTAVIFLSGLIVLFGYSTHRSLTRRCTFFGCPDTFDETGKYSSTELYGNRKYSTLPREGRDRAVIGLVNEDGRRGGGGGNGGGGKRLVALLDRLNETENLIRKPFMLDHGGESDQRWENGEARRGEGEKCGVEAGHNSGSPSSSSSSSFSETLVSTVAAPLRVAQLKVYVYTLPKSLNLPLTMDTYNRRFSNRLFMHAAEYWILEDLMQRGEVEGCCAQSRAVRVDNPDEADVALVPFLGSQSFEHCRDETLRFHRFSCRNIRDEQRQELLVNWLVNQPSWQKSGGYDHVFVLSHPLAMATARRVLSHAVFLTVDFGYYCADEVSVQKDVVIPYQHVVPAMTETEMQLALTNTTSRRFARSITSSAIISNFTSTIIAPAGAVYKNQVHIDGKVLPALVGSASSQTSASSMMLLYFCGEVFRHNGGIIRYKLWLVLKDEPDVDWVTTQWTNFYTPKLALETSGMRMRNSEFCLSPAGDSPTSARLFDAFQSMCIPVVVSDYMEFPFERSLNWTELVVMVKEEDAIKAGYLVNLLRGIDDEQRLAMRRRIAKVLPHFKYAYSWNEPQGAVNFIWEEVRQRLPVIELQKRRHGRGLDTIQTLDLKAKRASPPCNHEDDPSTETELIKAKEDYERMSDAKLQAAAAAAAAGPNRSTITRSIV